MATFPGADGTQLAYHRSDAGASLICVPGGPMQASAYLDGLPLPVVRLDLRGTGDSAIPADESSYRYDRQVDDVEALRVHLGVDTVDLLAHSGGAAIAVLYAARYPARVARLVLVCPSPRVVGVTIADEDRGEIAELRRGEPWFAAAYAAFERIWSGDPSPADWDAIDPFTHGSWDAGTQAYNARGVTEVNVAAARAYYSEGVPDPDATRAALADLPAQVLLVAGEYDVALPPKRAAEYAALFPNARLAVQPAAGHYPWRDDPTWFTRTVADFLA